VVVRGLVINRFPFDGIDVRANADGLGPTGVKVEGNLIGTGAAGREDLGNGTSGVLLVEARNTTVGGTTPDARNLISANASDGVSLVSADNNKVEGNLVGTQRDGTSSPVQRGRRRRRLQLRRRRRRGRDARRRKHRRV
jgi:nitrous oxidase accessory protein NosD